MATSFGREGFLLLPPVEGLLEMPFWKDLLVV